MPAILVVVILGGSRVVMASGEGEPDPVAEPEPLSSTQVEAMRDSSTTRGEWQEDVDRIEASGAAWSQVPLGPYDDAIAFCREAELKESPTPSQAALCKAIDAAAAGRFEPGVYETDKLLQLFGGQQP